MLALILSSIRATLTIAFLTGFIFPVLITILGNLIFPEQAGGSLIRDEKGQVIGSCLIGQNFTGVEYFHPRPSAAGSAYCGEASSGTNLGPTSAKLIEGLEDDPQTPDTDESYNGVKQLAHRFRVENELSESQKIPVDAVTRSGSGLDPHISIYNAELQAPRVARTRGLNLAQIKNLIVQNTEQKQFGILGEPGVNVLKLNLAIDKTDKSSRKGKNEP